MINFASSVCVRVCVRVPMKWHPSRGRAGKGEFSVVQLFGRIFQLHLRSSRTLSKCCDIFLPYLRSTLLLASSPFSFVQINSISSTLSKLNCYLARPKQTETQTLASLCRGCKSSNHANVHKYVTRSFLYLDRPPNRSFKVHFWAALKKHS